MGNACQLWQDKFENVPKIDPLATFTVNISGNRKVSN